MSGPIPAGSPRVRASARCTNRLPVLDQSGTTDRFEVALGQLLVAGGKELLASGFFPGGIAVRLSLAADGKHLHSLLCYFGRRQVSKRHAIQCRAQLLGKIGTVADDGIANSHVRQSPRDTQTFLAALEASAQSFRIAATGLESIGRRAALHNEEDWTQVVFVSDVGLFIGLAAECVEDVLL